jgi:catechol 2,3-dioxygenase
MGGFIINIMTDNTATARPDSNVHPGTRIAYVSLNVSDIDKSLDFYGKVLGFKKVERSPGERVLLSANGIPSYLVELLYAKERAVAGYNPQGSGVIRRAGLYHFAILLPERKYLADALQNLTQRKDELRFDGLADHLVSESIYIRDPDNIGIEIYCDKPSLQWKWDGSRVRMTTARLDTEGLLKESTAAGWKGMPAKTVIGHVHLHVRDLAKAMKFYRDSLRLTHTASYPGAYFFAAGRYHHHIATNIWLGTNIHPASSEDVGLNHFSIELPNKEQYEKTAERLTQYKIHTPRDLHSSASKGSFFRDADGITIQLYTS